MKPQPLTENKVCIGKEDYPCREDLFRKSDVASAVAWLKGQLEFWKSNVCSGGHTKYFNGGDWSLLIRKIDEAFVGVVEVKNEN